MFFSTRLPLLLSCSHSQALSHALPLLASTLLRPRIAASRALSVSTCRRFHSPLRAFLAGSAVAGAPPCSPAGAALAVVAAVPALPRVRTLASAPLLRQAAPPRGHRGRAVRRRLWPGVVRARAHPRGLVLARSSCGAARPRQYDFAASRRAGRRAPPPVQRGRCHAAVPARATTAAVVFGLSVCVAGAPPVPPGRAAPVLGCGRSR